MNDSVVEESRNSSSIPEEVKSSVIQTVDEEESKEESKEEKKDGTTACGKISRMNTRRKLRKTVETNRKSMTKLTPKKQLETCCICLEDIDFSHEAVLDSC